MDDKGRAAYQKSKIFQTLSGLPVSSAVRLNWSSMMTAACARCPSRYTSPWLRNTASPAGALDGISAQPGTTPGREDAKNSLKKSAVEPSMRPHLSGN